MSLAETSLMRSPSLDRGIVVSLSTVRLLRVGAFAGTNEDHIAQAIDSARFCYGL